MTSTGNRAAVLDRIVARFIPDPSTRAAAMEKGEVHFAAFDAILSWM